MKNGLYPGLSLSQYLAIDAAHHSVLRKFNRSAAHAQHEILHPPEPTSAQELGTATHMALLEPERFRHDYAEMPKVDRRTKAGKDAWAEFERAHPGATVISDEDAQHIRGMQGAVEAHPLAVQALRTSPGISEVTFVWERKADGLITPCKGRLDRFCKIAGRSVVVDLKTTPDASPRGFARAAANWGYHSQAAFYLDGLGALSGAERAYWIVAVEKESPYGVSVFELDEPSLEQGRREYQRWLWLYREAVASGVWPAYDSGLQSLSIPRWAFDAPADLSEVF